MRRITNAHSIFSILVLIGFLVLSLYLMAVTVQACFSNSDCGNPSFGYNYCCNGNRCNTAYIPTCVNIDPTYGGDCVTAINTDTHEWCSCGCSGGYCQSCYSYPTPAYGYPTPAYEYPTPGYGYPTPGYGYPTPAYGYPTPAYGYPTPTTPNNGSINVSVNPTSGAPSSTFTTDIGGTCGGCEVNFSSNFGTASCINGFVSSGCPNWNWRYSCTAPSSAQTVTLTASKGSCPGTHSATYTVTVTGTSTSIPPDPVTGATSSCPSPGTSATVSWNNVSGATYYQLRVDDATSNTALLREDITVNSRTFTSTGSHTYNWGVDACNSAGCSGGSLGAQSPFTCAGVSPWIQTTGGDVHSNENIYTPGGP